MAADPAEAQKPRYEAVDETAPYWPAAERAQRSGDNSQSLGAVWTVAEDPKAARPAVKSKPPVRRASPVQRKAPPPPVKPAVKLSAATPAATARPIPQPKPKPATVSTQAPASATSVADKIILEDATKGCAARDGNACLILGRMYATGTIATRDTAAAVRSYKQGCDLRSGAACHTLGVMHEKGTGVAVNAHEAGRYYALGCKHGNASACSGAKRLSAKTAPGFRLPDFFSPRAPAP